MASFLRQSLDGFARDEKLGYTKIDPITSLFVDALARAVGYDW